MGTTNKFHVLTFLNYLGGGDSCSLSVFDDRLYFSSPELVSVGEPKRVLEDIRRSSLFLEKSEMKLELLQSFEKDNLLVVEVRLPAASRDVFAILFFEFSAMGIQKIQSFYPAVRSLSLGEENLSSQNLHMPADVEMFKKFLVGGQKNAFFQLFDQQAMIRDAHGHYFGTGAKESLEDFWIRYSRTDLEVLRIHDAGRICVAEVKWRRTRGAFVWLRSEDRLFVSCRYYGNEKLDLAKPVRQLTEVQAEQAHQ